MSRTDRDQKKYIFKHHHKDCTRRVHVGPFKYYKGFCECLDWYEYQHARFWPVPSYYKRETRQKERAFARNRMQRARSGSRDWDGVDELRGDEYYW